MKLKKKMSSETFLRAVLSHVRTQMTVQAKLDFAQTSKIDQNVLGYLPDTIVQISLHKNSLAWLVFKF